jgi:hypothetical protein
MQQLMTVFPGNQKPQLLQMQTPDGRYDVLAVENSTPDAPTE